VQASSSLKSLAEDSAAPTASAAVRVVDDRAYFLKDGIWTDSLYAGETTVDIAAYSAAYFELVDVVPWIGPHLALGDKVVVRVGSVFVRIGAEGAETLTFELETLLAP
jgi:hypothetical protein